MRKETIWHDEAIKIDKKKVRKMNNIAKELFFDGECVVYLNGISLVERAIKKGNKVFIVQCDYDYQDLPCRIIEEIELKKGNIEGLQFPICKTSYKRVIQDLQNRGFVLVGNKFLSSNYNLEFIKPFTEYGHRFPKKIKGEIKII